MRAIGKSRIFTFREGLQEAVEAECDEIRRGGAYPVADYKDLASKIAELQFRNQDFVFLYRGQQRDYHDVDGKSTLKASIFRGGSAKPNPSKRELKRRFEALLSAEAIVSEEYANRQWLGQLQIRRQRLLRWAIIQHYELCPTPLIDVTHSLRIAASFASKSPREEAHLFVLGIPNLSGAITVSVESGLQVVRLSSVCPPQALRPHLQEGYLLGEYPDPDEADADWQTKHYERDFGRRLIAKFKFVPEFFWHDAMFPQVLGDALYPQHDDPLLGLVEVAKWRLSSPRKSAP